MLKEFKEFAMKSSMVDMAVGIMLGSAFGALVNSLVNDVMMPPIGFLLQNVDFSDLFLVLKQGNPPGPYATLAEARTAGAVTWNYGLFISAMVKFLIITAVLFFMVKALNRIKREAAASEPKERPCPFCQLAVKPTATRCPHCTSILEPLTT
ncbi:MAG: large conductance mechanosensitive channel protein MscL [Candidatus Caldarchaeum sp.]